MEQRLVCLQRSIGDFCIQAVLGRNRKAKSWTGWISKDKDRIIPHRLRLFSLGKRKEKKRRDVNLKLSFQMILLFKIAGSFFAGKTPLRPPFFCLEKLFTGLFVHTVTGMLCAVRKSASLLLPCSLPDWFLQRDWATFVIWAAGKRETEKEFARGLFIGDARWNFTIP